MEETPKTVLVTGLPRGGTSAVSHLVSTFIDWPLPGDKDPGTTYFPNSEDYSYNNMENPNLALNSRNFCPNVAKYNEHYFTWGFKQVHLFCPDKKYVWENCKSLRNPHFILVYRDREAIIESHIRRIEYPRHKAEQIVDTRLLQMDDFALRPQYPIMLIHYTDLLTDPLSQARRIKNYIKETAEITDKERDSILDRVSNKRGATQ